MVKQIRWTPDADNAFEAIAIFINDNFSAKLAFKFADAVYKKIDILTKHPFMGRISPIDTTVRIIQVDKNHILFYSYDNFELVIIDIFDTR